MTRTFVINNKTEQQISEAADLIKLTLSKEKYSSIRLSVTYTSLCRFPVGFSYLINNIRNGIITPLTLEYETSVLALTRASSLEEALEISRNSKGSGTNS
jgi:hypothetical protein